MKRVVSIICEIENWRKEMNAQVTILVAFLIASSWSGNLLAQVADFDVGKAAGAYLGAQDLFEKLSLSSCGYAIDKHYSMEETLDIVMAHLDSKHKDEIASYFKSSEGKDQLNENSDLIDGFFASAKVDGLDEKTACGMLLSNTSTILEAATVDWTNILYRYDRGDFECQTRAGVRGYLDGSIGSNKNSIIIGEFIVSRATGEIEGYLSRVQKYGQIQVLENVGIDIGHFSVITSGPTMSAISRLNIYHASPEHIPSFTLFTPSGQMYVGTCTMF